jgi:two-component system OmpR family response regulator
MGHGARSRDDWMLPHARVLLIDGDTELISLLSDYLKQDGFTVHAESDGARGVAEALTANYQIIVLDVMMPRLNSLNVLGRIRQESTAPVLMLTTRGEGADRITGLELGADDYVPKPCTPPELVARIRAILRRTYPVAASRDFTGPIVSGDLRMWPEERRAEWLGEVLPLTSTEFSLLEILLRHVGRPGTKQELSEGALGRPKARHDRSIDVHLSSIRRKVGMHADGRSRMPTKSSPGYSRHFFARSPPRLQMDMGWA